MKNWSELMISRGPFRCRNGWHWFGFHCFNFDTTPRSWTDAEEFKFLEKMTGGSTITRIGGNDGGRPEITQNLVLD
ncbi:hypothetical protein DPEC_G00009010 [Dallia pectoralis]|uniref:Uncharacterized protein n=1 Tax=Dallia pectoralis TaxID=75939 RepID=A0ACC2HKU1_DALPE|nr:hypothetical protein DPEC_G00009010 [Dallia pectoralis]